MEVALRNQGGEKIIIKELNNFLLITHMKLINNIEDIIIFGDISLLKIESKK